MCRSNAFKNSFGGLAVAEVAVLARQEDPRRVLLLRRLGDVCSNSHAVEARAAGDHAYNLTIGCHDFVKIYISCATRRVLAFAARSR